MKIKCVRSIRSINTNENLIKLKHTLSFVNFSKMVSPIVMKLDDF